MADVAGLVLGALPVAIMAIENYLKGLELRENYKNYQQTLQGIRRNIFIQQQQLQVTLESIALRKPTLQEVKQRLREVKLDCYQQFIDILEHMDSITSRLLEKLDIDSNGKPKWTDANPGRASWEWRRVKRSFGDMQRKELFHELQYWNNALRNCLEPKHEISSDYSDPLTWELVRSFSLKSCDETRKNVQIVHKALAAAWSKNCADPQHPSNVELIWQHTGLKEAGQLRLSVPEPGVNVESNYWQRILISVDTKQVNPTFNYTVNPSLLSTTQLAPPPTLLSKEYKVHKARRLGNIFSSSWRSGLLYQITTLEVQRWLEEGWLGKEDITLLVDTPTQDNSFSRPKTYPTLSYTFMSQKEPSDKSLGSLHPDRYLETQIRHKTLFSLGVLLIELGLNKTLNQLRSDMNAMACEASIQEDYMIANQVIESQEIELELGESYANAVQRCIQCHFLGRESTQNFSHSGFRRQFFTGVVAPVQATFDAQITSVHSL
ncbi:hypothetical protein GGR58DRAFT_506656 [Xylaria digitata]|nr:hypothetical protein GGR58DRAFT_506656 [Xylaria digitata]